MENIKSISIVTTRYAERPSKNMIDSHQVEVKESDKCKIENIEICKYEKEDSFDQAKLIITIMHYDTDNSEIVTIPFSYFITNKPTNIKNRLS